MGNSPKKLKDLLSAPAPLAKSVADEVFMNSAMNRALNKLAELPSVCRGSDRGVEYTAKLFLTLKKLGAYDPDRSRTTHISSDAVLRFVLKNSPQLKHTTMTLDGLDELLNS